MDNFNFELAIKFCERALDMEPENVEVLEMAGAVFLETGDVDKAKSVSFKFDMSYIITQILFVVTCFSSVSI